MSSFFDSHETGEPFTHCTGCDCDLSKTSMHMVNQSYAGEECIFELAMCIECRENMHQQLSEKSRVAMFDFMHDHADMETRERELGTGSDTAAYLSHCITCHADKATLKHYSLGAMFTGDGLLKGPFPMLICGSCEEKINATLSKETRDFWHDFIAEHFPGPPSELNLPTHKPAFF